jgi:hypothetical protein
MTRTGEKKVQKGSIGKTLAFKYYIHDTAEGYALEMSGPFTESSVAELACCWHTAKTTLKGRTLTLDLRGLTSIDEGAKQWLAAMSHEGAKYLPESFMRDAVAGMPGRQKDELAAPVKRSFLGRLLTLAR